MANHDDLYFVRAGGFVKIGRTRNLSARLVSIQTGCPLPIEGVYHFPRMGCLEKELHWSLFAERSHGEWFHWGDAVEKQLNEMRRRAFVRVQAMQYLEERANSLAA